MGWSCTICIWSGLFTDNVFFLITLSKFTVTSRSIMRSPGSTLDVAAVFHSFAVTSPVSSVTNNFLNLLDDAISGSGEPPLAFEKLNTLRSKLENLTLLIIDEISMVGSEMFLDIHRRLNEIKGISWNGIWFGGDLYQLPPVQQLCIYKPVKDAMAKMCGSGSIFMDEFFLPELSEIMRQKDDLSFADMLGRIRTGKWNNSDIAMLKSRVVNVTDPSYPQDALHAFAFNKDVNEHNMKKLNELATEKVVIHANDDKYNSTGAIDVSKLPPSKSRTETGGIETALHLAIGARVMMTVNNWWACKWCYGKSCGFPKKWSWANTCDSC